MVRVNEIQSTVYSRLAVEETPKILVVDDHQLILTGTLNVLLNQYPNAKVSKAESASEVLEHLKNSEFDLIVMDLSIPNEPGGIAVTETGIELLLKLLQKYPTQNFLVQTSYVKALVRIKHDIDNHQGGFAIADKGLRESDMLARLQLALQGATHTKDIKTGIELKPEWMDVLRLAFEESLTDKTIAERMYKSERAIRTYWTKIQDVLNVYPEDCKKSGVNMRIKTEVRAREEGLID
jgi:DNA-binding NarL/FixJ family response regulator